MSILATLAGSTALSGLAGTAISGGLNYLAGKREQRFNLRQAETQRNWDKMMSDTAIRRQMADYKAAGLNPLNVLNTSGASTPSASKALSGDLNPHISPDFLMDIQRQRADISKTRAETKVAQASEKNIKQNTAKLAEETVSLGRDNLYNVLMGISKNMPTAMRYLITGGNILRELTGSSRRVGLNPKE